MIDLWPREVTVIEIIAECLSELYPLNVDMSCATDHRMYIVLQLPFYLVLDYVFLFIYISHILKVVELLS